MRICLVAFFNQYESKRYFCDRLAEALKKEGVETLLVDPPVGLISGEIQTQINSFRPDFLISFNSTHVDERGKYYWDYLEVPYLNALVDPAFYAVDMARSPLTFFTTVDREDCAWMRKNGVKNTFFWPHAVEANPPLQRGVEKLFDVVFLGTCTDFLGLQMEWQSQLTEGEIAVLKTAIDRMLSPPLSSLSQALAGSFAEQHQDPAQFNFKKVFHYLDNYVRGKDRYELIRSLKGVQVHLFGEPSWNNPQTSGAWKHYIKDLDHVTLHPPVGYKESFKIAQQAKICLSSSPFFKHGSHERILNAFISGAVPLTTHNGFVEEFFSPGEDLLTYLPGKWEGVNDQVKSLLANEKKRAEMAELGKSKVLAHHTWDNRAKELQGIWKEMLINFL
jgi:spore maturation protein CgeB